MSSSLSCNSRWIHHAAAGIKAGAELGRAAYYATPALSWQTIVIGDPLYRPFAVPLEAQLANLAGFHLTGPLVLLRKARLLEHEKRPGKRCGCSKRSLVDGQTRSWRSRSRSGGLRRRPNGSATALRSGFGQESFELSRTPLAQAASRLLVAVRRRATGIGDLTERSCAMRVGAGMACDCVARSHQSGACRRQPGPEGGVEKELEGMPARSRMFHNDNEPVPQAAFWRRDVLVALSEGIRGEAPLSMKHAGQEPVGLRPPCSSSNGGAIWERLVRSSA